MVRYTPLPLGSIQPRGWLKQQLADDLAHGFAGRLDALTARAATDLFTTHIDASQSQFAWWDAETRGNWLWGYVMMAFLADGAAHIARATALIEALLAAQEPDGYLGIYSPQWRYQHPAGENGELWAQSRALLPLLAFHEFTGRADVLAAVERAVALTMAHYGPGRSYYRRGDDPHNQLVGLTHGLNYVDVMAWLHRITHNTAYRDWGVWLYDDFCALPTPFPQDDIALPNLIDPHRHWNGHAVHTAEHLRVLFWAAAVTDREELWEGVGHAQRKLMHYLLPSGALIGDEGVHGLPTPDSGYEYCTLTELSFSMALGLAATGLGWFGDMLEKIALNAAQGARLADGTAIAYLCSDTNRAAIAERPDSYSHLHGGGGRFKFSPTHDDVACCCNPNATRLLSHYIAALWMRADDGLVATAYGPSILTTTINGVAVTIEQDTAYPFGYDITFTITPSEPTAFALTLRAPHWSGGLQIEPSDAMLPSDDPFPSEITLYQKWAAGDVVRVKLDPYVRVESYPLGDVGVFYGPLQFALPIDHQMRALRGYLNSDLHDMEFRPQSVAAAHRVLIVDEMQPDFGFMVEAAPAADLSRPWGDAPITLRHPSGDLIPLGCTVLRQAAFPREETEF